MRNLYVPFSQYHLILSFALAAEHSDDDNVLILGDSDPGMVRSLDLLAELFSGVKINFTKLLPTSTSNNISNFWNKKRNIKKIKGILETDKFDRFYYFCEWSVYTTFISNFLNKKLCKFYFCEDGIATYTEQSIRDKSCIEEATDKLIYGRWHRSFKIPGALNSEASVACIFPHLMPPLYERREKTMISAEPLMEKINRNKIHEIKGLCDNVEFDEIIATDSADFSRTDEYRELIRTKIEEGISSGRYVALKRHPSDKNEYKKPGTTFYILPQYYPIELYYMVYCSSIKKVIGAMSTSLITARWLMRDIEIISLLAEADTSLIEGLDEKRRFLSELNMSLHTV